jgi:crotonobetainyl-CoA:carnitine CoA-transferase CaiB-like acyl-CoA transferase
VLIVNLVARIQGKLAVDYASLSAIKPDLVFVSLTGFGLEGARKDIPCYDLIAEGYSGVMDLTGEADSPAAVIMSSRIALDAGQSGLHGAPASHYELLLIKTCLGSR